MTRNVVAYIDKNALAHNLKCVRNLIKPKTKILAMVKGNAYGHGLLSVAQALSDADAFGIAAIENAILLRKKGIKRPIVLMSGFLNQEELECCHQYRLSPVIHSDYQLQLLQKANFKFKLPQCWLKIETGMNRLGMPVDALKNMVEHIKMQSCEHEPILMSHLATADSEETDYAIAQHERFATATSSYSLLKSLCNSAAMLDYPKMHYDWVRPGIMLYGVSPFLQRPATDFKLQPVLTLAAQLIAIRNHKKGEYIGYGCAYRCKRDSIIGVINIGYADGYPRTAESGIPVLINGQRCPLVGRVSMDLITIDLTDLATLPSIGDQAVLWGKGLPIEEVARQANRYPYELLSQITSRVNYVDVE